MLCSTRILVLPVLLMAGALSNPAAAWPSPTANAFGDLPLTFRTIAKLRDCLHESEAGMRKGRFTDEQMVAILRGVISYYGNITPEALPSGSNINTIIW